MPRATELSLRLALDRMVRSGATASDITRQLGLSVSTVRGLMRRAHEASRDHTSDAWQPRYNACGPRPLAAPPMLEATLALRRQHPRWGGGRIRVELSELNPGTALPSVRTMQRWLLEHGLAPAPPGRRPATAWPRAPRPHDIWEIDAAEQKKLADGRLISWLRVVDECTGAALQTRVFPPGLLQPGAFRNSAGRTPPLLQTLGPTGVGASGQRQSLGSVWRPADAVGSVADRLGHRRDLESAAAAAGQRCGGAEPGCSSELGRARPLPRRGDIATPTERGGPGATRVLPVRLVPVPVGGVPESLSLRAALQPAVGASTMVLDSGAGSTGRRDDVPPRGLQREDRSVPREALCGDGDPRQGRGTPFRRRGSYVGDQRPSGGGVVPAAVDPIQRGLLA